MILLVNDVYFIHYIMKVGRFLFLLKQTLNMKKKQSLIVRTNNIRYIRMESMYNDDDHGFDWIMLMVMWKGNGYNDIYVCVEMKFIHPEFLNFHQEKKQQRQFPLSFFYFLVDFFLRKNSFSIKWKLKKKKLKQNDQKFFFKILSLIHNQCSPTTTT